MSGKGTVEYHMTLRGQGVCSNRHMGEEELAKPSHNYYSG